MAKYSNTKAKINEKITTNGAQAVTGSILNDVLQTMVDSLGADYQFGGLVQPGSSFTAGEQPVVFLATTPGTYTNFGGIVVADGEVALLVWSGSAWSKQTPDISTRTELNQLGQIVGVTEQFTSSGGYFFPFFFEFGKTYKISYDTLGNQITASARVINDFSETDYDIIFENENGEGTVLFSPTKNANYLRVNNACSISIILADSHKGRLDNLDYEVSDIQCIIDNYSSIIDNYSNFESTGGTFKPYHFIKGKTYYILYDTLGNQITASARVTNDLSETNYDTIFSNESGVSSVEFTPTKDANYLRVNNACNISIIDKQSNIFGLDKDIYPWRGKAWASYGDSIVAGNTWQPRVTQVLRTASHYNLGIGGTNFKNFAGWTRITSAFTSYIKNNISLVVIMGGTNDIANYYSESSEWLWGEASLGDDYAWDDAWIQYCTNNNLPIGDFPASALKGAVASCIMKIRTLMPNVQIVVVGNTPTIGDTNAQNETQMYENPTWHNTPLIINDAIKDVCEYLSTPFIDLFGNMGVNFLNRADYVTDTVHPNALGGKMIAKTIIGGMKNILPIDIVNN